MLLLLFCIDGQRLALISHFLLLQVGLQFLKICLYLVYELGVMVRLPLPGVLEVLSASELGHGLVCTRGSLSGDSLRGKLDVRAGHGVKNWHVSQSDLMRRIELINCQFHIPVVGKVVLESALLALYLLLGQLGLAACFGFYFERHDLAKRRFIEKPVLEALVRVEGSRLDPRRAFTNSRFLPSFVLFCQLNVQWDVRIRKSVAGVRHYTLVLS